MDPKHKPHNVEKTFRYVRFIIQPTLDFGQGSETTTGLEVRRGRKKGKEIKNKEEEGGRKCKAKNKNRRGMKVRGLRSTAP